MRIRFPCIAARPNDLAGRARTRTVIILCSVAVLSAPSTEPEQLHRFDDPVDAISIGVHTDDIDLEMSAKVDGVWLAWETLEIEKEFDPLLRESNLVMFPKPVTEVRVRGNTADYDMHPLRVSTEPPSYEVAALSTVTKPRILTRSQWGADESLLIDGNPVERSDVETEEPGNEGSTSSARVQQCKEWQTQYPQDFRTTRTVTHTPDGQLYRWPQQYSGEVRLLTVHHTAIKVTGDERPAYERMRALYAYHANSRGWGDIGYHFMIDEDGQIYEGRAGGRYVVGGHAYCSNVATVGIALMGNFDIEQPTQDQIKALQWLLLDLSKQYKIDLSTQVDYHGIRMERIVGHGTLVSTLCPGYYVNQVMSQVRRHATDGSVGLPVRFPTVKKTQREGITVSPIPSAGEPVVMAVGSTDLSGLPGGQTKISMLFRAGNKSMQQRDRIAEVRRSDTRIGLWQDGGQGREVRVREELLLPQGVRPSATLAIPLRIQFPREAGTYTLQIGDVKFTLKVSGRRTTDPALRGRLTPSAADATARVQPSIVRARPTTNAPSDPQRSTPGSIFEDATRTIRIRLGYTGDQAILRSGGLTVTGKTAAYQRLTLRKEADTCIAYDGTTAVSRGIIRVSAVSDSVTIESWKVPTNRFRGIIECRVIDGQLVLINELPLEAYMAGLAEEPDTEPYEKQRAFAIAARSYAAHYTEAANRKFPGMPYDGDDSPARFQMYGGVTFEERNPHWVEAVESTLGIVVKKDGKIVKTPYFSSDDGRTRSPDENGWKNFPFAEVFTSKPDPWCSGMELRGHGVGMSGCGAKAQAEEGKTAEEILRYYYPGTQLTEL
jgi:hypothetical protein